MLPKNELYFQIPDDVRVMTALVRSVPAAWGKHGWVDGYLYSMQKNDHVTFVEAGRDLQHLGVPFVSFDQARTKALNNLERGYRGWLEFVVGAYEQVPHKRLATCHLQLASWRDPSGRESGEHPRVRLAWHSFVKNARPGGYDPVVDTEGSGKYEHVAPIAEFCRQLGLREYEMLGASDSCRDWDAEPLLGKPYVSAIAAE